MNMGLKRIKGALEKIDNPCLNIPAIQIIGTNGKGSITAFLENILSFSSINIGVTTSPHLFKLTERIRVNKENISQKSLNKLLNHLQKELEEFELSPFELVICCALKFFDTNKVDLLLLEAGLGGRLDATTAHKLRSIIAISKIGIDHKEYLGESLKEIATEKVAVIEKNSLVISCRQSLLVEDIIKAKVEKVGAKLFFVTQLSDDWELGLNGFFQKENAAVAVGVIKALAERGWDINQDMIRNGLATTKWPGRLELINWKSRQILVDAAHNPSGAKALARERENWTLQERGVLWILGIQKQKDINTILKTLIKPLDTVFLVPVINQASWKLNDIKKHSSTNKNKIIEFESLLFALNYLENMNEWPSCHPVLTGSIFLVSEFIQLTRSKINS